MPFLLGGQKRICIASAEFISKAVDFRRENVRAQSLIGRDAGSSIIRYSLLGSYLREMEFELSMRNRG